jgi:hypothetical protein
MSTQPTWEGEPLTSPELDGERPSMEIDIACAGFGPAMGGFLTTLTNAWNEHPGDPCFESPACLCRYSATSAPTISPPESVAS